MAVVAGMGPPEVLTFRQAGWYTVSALWLHIYAPTLLKRGLNWFLPLETIHDDEKLQKLIENTVKWLPAETRKELADIQKPENSREMRAHLRCIFAQGWDGTIRDGQIYASPWGFQLQDVKKKVLLIYGESTLR